jgi:hypothetical protein
MAGLGGPAWFNGSGEISYNTIVNSPFLDYSPNTDYGAIAEDSYDVHHNVIVDNRGTAYAATLADGMQTLGHFVGSTNYAAMVASWDQDNNCFINTEDQDLFFSRGGSSGATYTTFAAWKAGSGFDASSFEEDPTLDQYYRATSANCNTFGYAPGSTGGDSESEEVTEDADLVTWGSNNTSALVNWGSDNTNAYRKWND